MKFLKFLIIFIIVISGIFVSGCTDNQDVSSIFSALPEVQQFLDDNPNARMNVVYWSSSEIETIVLELEKQFDKPVTPVAMYKATVTDGNVEVIAWIDASTRTVLFTSTSYIGAPVQNDVVGSSVVDIVDDVIDTPVIVPQPETVPQVALRLVERDDVLDVIHQGGDTLDLNNVAITVYYKGSFSYDVYSPVCISNLDFVSGDVLTITPTGIRHNVRGVTSDVSLKHLDARPTSTSVEIVDILTGQFLAVLEVDTVGDVIETPVIVPQPKTAPQLSLRLIEVDDGLEILHQGGDTLDLNNVCITVYQRGFPCYEVYKPVDVNSNMFSPGQQLTITLYGIRYDGLLLKSGMSVIPSDDISTYTFVEIVDMSTGMFLADLSV
ncbi:MAG: hypothetical protein KAR20_04760 [Candidatus Heimdallarchaeota archaeon]|nr:hypothetical protein [Candidatus Heimdallarchaeota archaeon]